MAVVYTVNGWSKLWPMKTRTIIMMLTPLIAGLVIGCSSAPKPNFSEKEAIAIARTYDQKSEKPAYCFDTKGRNPNDYDYTNFRHTASATFKSNGLWLVTAKSSYNYERSESPSTDSLWWRQHLEPPNNFPESQEYDCLYLVDDDTGKVRPN